MGFCRTLPDADSARCRPARIRFARNLQRASLRDPHRLSLAISAARPASLVGGPPAGVQFPEGTPLTGHDSLLMLRPAGSGPPAPQHQEGTDAQRAPSED